MVAIITDTFKKQILSDLYTSIIDSNNTYYVGVGRSEDWDSSDTPTTPNNTAREIRNFRLSLQAIKSAEDVEYVIPRYNWSSGTIYTGYDDNVVGYPTNAYYVFTDENAIYMCLQQGRDTQGNAVPSTVKPTGTLTYPVTTADGYVWKYMYTISALTATKFVSANYITAQYIESVDSSSTALQIEQKAVQDAAIVGEVVGVALTNAGSGYTSAPTISFTGNGTKAPKATATVSGGQVVKVEMDDSASAKAYGRGYDYASVVFTGGGGTGAAGRPILSTPLGLGGDPRDDLRSTALMFNSQIAGVEGGQFKTSNDFRQVALIKNPKVAATDSDFSATAGNAMKLLKLSSVATAFSEDNTIEGTSSSAKAIVDDADSNHIYFHQTEATGFGLFQEGETITEVDGVGEGILDSAGADGDDLAYTQSLINPLSGDIFYIDNRAAVERSNEQTEDIKVIIQL